GMAGVTNLVIIPWVCAILGEGRRRGVLPQIPAPQHPGLPLAFLNHPLVWPPHPTPSPLPWLSSLRTRPPPRRMARGSGGARSRPRPAHTLAVSSVSAGG